ncbi:MAG: NUDIX domain-containing protein [Desulfovibrionales bacterium]
MPEATSCPHCGKPLSAYRNPIPTVDALIYQPGKGIVLIERKNKPHGWALPGGFVDYGETVEHAAIREVREETGLDVDLIHLLGVYSSPDRDPRKHTLSIVFLAVPQAGQHLTPGDDASSARFFSVEQIPKDLAFDHSRIVDDFLSMQRRFGG